MTKETWFEVSNSSNICPLIVSMYLGVVFRRRENHFLLLKMIFFPPKMDYETKSSYILREPQNFANLHCRFDYIGQIYGGDFAKICSLLRIYELCRHTKSALFKIQYFKFPSFVLLYKMYQMNKNSPQCYVLLFSFHANFKMANDLRFYGDDFSDKVVKNPQFL